MSLVAHWQFENDTTDSVGSNHGSGYPNYVDGKLGRAIDGDGTNVNVPLSDNIRSAFTGNSMTLSLWWKQDNHTSSERWRDIFGFDRVRLERGAANSTNNADYWCNLGSGDGNQFYNSNIGVPSGEWFHIVVRRNGDDYEIWINGDVNQSGTRTADMNISGDVTINAQNSGSQIDDIRLYDHAISEKKITQLSRGKILHYKFDKAGAYDSSGQSNDGSVNGATHIDRGPIGSGAYEFDGNSNISVDHFYPSDYKIPELTLLAWIKVNNSGNIIHSWDRSEFWRFGIGGSTSSNSIDNGFNDDNGIHDLSANTDVTDGKWHHVAFIYNKGNVKFYIDGEVDATYSTGGSAIQGSFKRYGFIGAYSETNTFGKNGGSFDGDINDVRIYHTALTDEIKEIYQQRASIDSGGNLHGHELSERVSSGLSLEAYSRGNNS